MRVAARAALSDYDPLTGLVDRHPFLKAVRDELASGRSAGRSCATPIFDVEGLRHLNEQSGYEAGNATLQLVAEALKRVLRESDIAARWGGDEFAVLLPATDLGTAPAVGQRLRGAVHAATLEIAGRHLRGSVSVGCACAPRDGRSGETLLASGERRLERDRELRRDAPGVAASA